MNFIFSRPLFLLLVIPFLYIYYIYFVKPGNYDGIFLSINSKNNLTFFKKIYFNLHYIALFISAFFLIFALGKPQKIESVLPVQKNGRAFIFCLDISSSMKAIEKSGKSRLDIAKEEIINFVKSRPFDLYGLVIFAKYPFTYVPLTIDNKFLTEKLSEIEPLIIEDGSSIGLGIESAISQLSGFNGSGKSIILLTDGVDSSDKFSPIRAAEEAKNKGIKIYSIIPGSNKDILFPFKNNKGEIELKKINLPVNTKLLKKISNITGVENVYFATDQDKLKDVFYSINRNEPVTYRISLYKQYKDIYMEYIFYSFLFFSIFLFLYFINMKVEY